MRIVTMYQIMWIIVLNILITLGIIGYPIKSLLRMLKFEARFNILTFVGCKESVQKDLNLKKNLLTWIYLIISTKPITFRIKLISTKIVIRLLKLINMINVRYYKIEEGFCRECFIVDKKNLPFNHWTLVNISYSMF